MRFAFCLRKHLDFSDHTPLSRARSGDDRNGLLVLRVLRARSGRQLQHNCMLPLAQPGDEHNLPVRELECVVMHVRLILADLPEARHFLFDLFPELQIREKTMLVFDLFLERDLRAGKEAHGYVWFSDRGKTASDRVAEFRRHQFVSDHCRSRCDELQTVVAHRRYPTIANNQYGCPVSNMANPGGNFVSAYRMGGPPSSMRPSH